MFLIAGLGNPGSKYEKTRHNAGFDTIDVIADHYGIRVNRLECEAITGKGIIEGEKVILAKPQTFMNLSGNSIRKLVDYYKLDPTSEVIVIFDDIDLEPGNLRIKKKGSAGGHNGIKSIISSLGTEKFERIKIGTGAKPAGWDLVNWVLGRFSGEDRKLVEQTMEEACEAAALMVQGQTDQAMNRFNRKNREAEHKPE